MKVYASTKGVFMMSVVGEDLHECRTIPEIENFVLGTGVQSIIDTNPHCVVEGIVYPTEEGAETDWTFEPLQIYDQEESDYLETPVFEAIIRHHLNVRE